MDIIGIFVVLIGIMVLFRICLRTRPEERFWEYYQPLDKDCDED